MDTLTHALSGMLLARATSRRRTATATSESVQQSAIPLRTVMLAGFLAAAFPDIDFILRLGDTLSYLRYHRGLTHSVLMLPLWAVVLAVTLRVLWRGRYRWQQFYPVCAMGIAIHIAGDVITAYGTMIFAPLSMVKVSWPSTFIIDAFFTAILIVSLLAAWIIKKRARQIAIIGLACLSTYIAFQQYLHQQAIVIAEKYVNQQGLVNADVNALPQPVSPFNWKLIIVDAEKYHIAYVNLIRETELPAARPEQNMFARANTLYQPLDKLDWSVQQRFGNNDTQRLARSIWNEPVLQGVREFMLFPILSHMEQREAGQCAWYQDHRFVLQGIRSPFRFGACRSSVTADWQLFRLQGTQRIAIP